MKTPDSIEKMNTYEMALLLQQIIEFAISEEEADPISEATLFEDSGVLTKNDGLVIQLTNGQEFQITIVRAK